jgi:hypothetical protein
LILTQNCTIPPTHNESETKGNIVRLQNYLEVFHTKLNTLRNTSDLKTRMRLIKDLTYSSNPLTQKVIDTISESGIQKFQSANEIERESIHRFLNIYGGGNCGNNAINIIYRLIGKIGCASPYFNANDYKSSVDGALESSGIKIKFDSIGYLEKRLPNSELTWPIFFNDIKQIQKIFREQLVEGDLALLELRSSDKIVHIVAMTKINKGFYIIADDALADFPRNQLLTFEEHARRFATEFETPLDKIEYRLLITTENINFINK